MINNQSKTRQNFRKHIIYKYYNVNIKQKIQEDK